MKHYLIGRLSRRRGHDDPLLIGRVEADSLETAAQIVGREIVPPPTGYPGTLQLGTVSEDDLFFPTFEERADIDSTLSSLLVLNAEMLNKFLRPR